VAEIPAKKLKRGLEKKNLTGRAYGRIAKVAEKGLTKFLKRNSLFFSNVIAL
jgi:hypothetical protein